MEERNVPDDSGKLLKPFYIICHGHWSLSLTVCGINVKSSLSKFVITPHFWSPVQTCGCHSVLVFAKKFISKA